MGKYIELAQSCCFNQACSDRFEKAFEQVERETLDRAAKVCRDYAHSGQNVYRRQVAYACESRIQALSSQPEQKKP